VATGVPIFPLNTVLFPDGLLPLRIFETRYMDMARGCLRESRPFGVCLIRSGREVGEAAVPEDVGTLATIVDCDMQQLGVLHVKTRGGERFRIRDRSVTSQGLVLAEVDPIADEDDAPLDARFSPCARLLRMIVADQKQEVFFEPHRFESTSWVGQRLAEVLPIPASAKQRLLELDDCDARLEILFRFLEQRGLLSEK
jgi:Lon protease-like protein